MKREQALQIRDLIPPVPTGASGLTVNIRTKWNGPDCVAVKVWPIEESEPSEWVPIHV